MDGVIDIKLPPDLQAALEKPRCADIKLPKPSIPQITTPHGAVMKAIADFTKGIPDDCSMSFNLIAQLPPFMLSIECLMRILGLVAPATKLLKAVLGDPQTTPPTPPNPTEIPGALVEVFDALAKLAECLNMINPLAILAFLRDLILLIAKLLRCLVEQLQSILTMVTQLNIELGVAKEAGDTGLAETLECAIENADLSTEGLLSSVESLMAILAMVKPFLDIAGKGDVELPTADIEGLETLEEVLDTLEAIAVALEQFAESLGA